MLGNLGPMELLMILVIVLVIFGAKRVPEIGASLGKGISEFKRSMSGIGEQLDEPNRSLRAPPPAVEQRPHDDDARSEPKRLLM